MMTANTAVQGKTVFLVDDNSFTVEWSKVRAEACKTSFRLLRGCHAGVLLLQNTAPEPAGANGAEGQPELPEARASESAPRP